jgi:hypothetical protein
MKSVKTIAFTFLALCALLEAPFTSIGRSAGTDDIFSLRSTTKTPDAVVDAVKKYSEQQKWQYLGANKVKQGQVTLVKVCIPEVGRQIWPVGLKLSAMLPCGNLGVYQNDGTTEISLLHPRYMQVLYPHPAVEKAAAIAERLLAEMLDTVAK